MRTSKKSILLVVAVAAGLPSGSMAQTPSRPGLVLQNPTGTVTPPTTNLVQHQYQPTQGVPGAAGQQPYYPVQSQQPDELFYIEDGAAGPDNLANGLSDYNNGRMSQAGAQLSGNYGSLSQSGMPSGQVQEAWNRPFDNMSAGQSAPGSIRYQWSADLVMPVRLRAGMVTSIVLPEWEAAEDVVIGDGSTVEAKIMRPNQIAVKSVMVGLDTSLSIIGGSGNIYTFYLRTEGRNTTLVSDLQVFVLAAPSKGAAGWFNDERLGAYSSSPAAMAATAGEKDNTILVPGAASQGEEPVSVDRRIFNLKMFEVNQGDRIIAPEYAYTDGRFTYLHYAAGVTDRPAVFRIVDGVEGRVNTRITGRNSEVIVVEALGDLILRSGTRAVCIKTVTTEDQVPDNQ